jgi:hypothetical protein
MCEKVGKSGEMWEGKYDCKLCSYVGRDNFDIARHLKTNKHIKSITDTSLEKDVLEKQLADANAENTKLKIQMEGKDEMIEILKKQLEQQNHIITQLSLKPPVQQTLIGGTHNTVNKFNLKIYLSETCKDAISFEKFIESFTITPDLFEKFIIPEKVDCSVHKTKIFGEIFHRNMCKYSQIERPIQTNDKIRSHFYYKVNDKWVNSQEDIQTFNKFLSKIEINKIMKLGSEYQKENIIEGNDESEMKFNKINVGLYSELNKEKFINSCIPKYTITK